MKIEKIVLLFFFFTIALNSQESINSSITEYNRLISKNRDSTLLFCNQLINSEDNKDKAFGLAGKANIYALRSNYDLADTLFKKAFQHLNLIKPRKKIEIKAQVLYLFSLRYIETHDLDKSINIINEALSLCHEDCSDLLKIKLYSALGRAYALSKNHVEALEISNKCLAQIREMSDFSTNND